MDLRSADYGRNQNDLIGMADEGHGVSCRRQTNVHENSQISEASDCAVAKRRQFSRDEIERNAEDKVYGAVFQ